MCLGTGVRFPAPPFETDYEPKTTSFNPQDASNQTHVLHRAAELRLWLGHNRSHVGAVALWSALSGLQSGSRADAVQHRRPGPSDRPVRCDEEVGGAVMPSYSHSNGRIYHWSTVRYRVRCTRCKWQGVRRQNPLGIPCPRCFSGVKLATKAAKTVLSEPSEANVSV
jgi:hypothetical protein